MSAAPAPAAARRDLRGAVRARVRRGRRRVRRPGRSGATGSPAARCAPSTAAPCTSSTAAAGRCSAGPRYRSLAEIPAPPELVVLAVPPAALEATVDEALAAGARAIVAITAGAADGDAGGPQDAALAARVRAAGAVLLGPNCLGVFDAGAELELVGRRAPGRLDRPRSRRAATSRSSSGCSPRRRASASRASSRSATRPTSRPPTSIRELAAHAATELIAVYVEDFRDGRAFAAAAHVARDRAGKPVAAARDRAHRGDRARRALAHRRAGQRRRRDRRRLPRRGDRARAHAAGADRPGRRAPARAPLPRAGASPCSPTAAATAGIAAGLAERARASSCRGSATRLAAELRGRPARHRGACANPVDLAGGGEQDIRTLRPRRPTRCSRSRRGRRRCCSPATSAATASTATTLGRGERSVAEALGRRRARDGPPARRPVDVRRHAGASATLRAAACRSTASIERAVGVLARLAGAARGRAARRAGAPARRRAGRERPATTAARALLAAAGVPFVGGRARSRTPPAAVRAAERDRLPGRAQGARPAAQVRRRRRRRSALGDEAALTRAIADLQRAARAAGVLGRAHGAGRRRASSC